MTKYKFSDHYGSIFNLHESISDSLDVEKLSYAMDLVNSITDFTIINTFHDTITHTLNKSGGLLMITHHLHTVKGLIKTDIKPCDFDKIIFLGEDSEGCSLFSCEKENKIHIFKGHLNSGYYRKTT